MALIRKAVGKSLCSSKQLAVTFQAVRTHFNRDFMPGPYPKTEEERRAAAKKYGMTPEEYKPYPDDGFGFGDYPKLPDVAGEAKDPYYNWDFPEHKRNYGDPIHLHSDAIGEDRWYINQRFRVPFGKQMAMFFGVVGGWIFIHFATYDYTTMANTVMPKQLPAQGPCYSFEKAE